MNEAGRDAGGSGRDERKRRLFVVLFVFVLAGLAAAGWHLAVLNRQQNERLARLNRAVKPPAAQTRNAPSFEIVRAEHSGALVAAGRAEPDATVRVMAGGKVLGAAKADENGEWVVQPAEPLKKGDYTITLEAVPEKGGAPVASPDQVAISIAGNKEKPLVAILSEDKPAKIVQQPEAKEQAAAEARSPAPAAPSSASPVKQAELKPKAPAAPAAPAKVAETSPANGTGRTKTATAARPQEAQAPQAKSASVAIASADYAENAGKGRLTIGGTASGEGQVGVYLDNDFVGMTPVKPDGSWSLKLPKRMFKRRYSIRADLAGKSGAGVTARAEIGFEPAPPEQMASAAEPLQAPAAPKAAAPRIAAAEPSKPRAESASPASPSAARTGRAESQLQAAEAGPQALSEPESEEASPSADEERSAAGEARSPKTAQRRAAPRSERRARTIIVRRGDTLWDIASRYYGRGFRYTRIYRSNREQIRDPDLIYPHQRIILPK
jgi:nucleoid-associated protein YgaU